MAKDKRKKEKVVYYDDGSSVADMSNLAPAKQKSLYNNVSGNSTKAKLRTFFGAMKLMVMPLLVFICAIGLMYAIIYFLFKVLGS